MAVGVFLMPIRVRIFVFNYLSDDDRREALRILDAYRASPNYASHSVRYYPDKDGLLLWGMDDNGAMALWDTRGAPDEWGVAVQPPRYYDVEAFDLSLTTFLARNFSRDMACVIWGPPFFTGPNSITFESCAFKWA
jgi:hypothetical protein